MDAVAEEPITLSPQTQAAIRRHVTSGRFTDAEHVLCAALFALDQQMRGEDEIVASFAPGELASLIAEGERSGPKVDGEAVFAALRARRPAAMSAVPAAGQ